MNYNSALIIAKQIVCSTGIERVITPKNNVYMTHQWDGKIIATVKAVGKYCIVTDEKGKQIEKTPLKKVVEKPKKEKSE